MLIKNQTSAPVPLDPRPDRPSAHEHERLSGNPARPDDHAANPDCPAPHVEDTNSNRDTSGAVRYPAAARRRSRKSSDGKDGKCIG